MTYTQHKQIKSTVSSTTIRLSLSKSNFIKILTQIVPYHFTADNCYIALVIFIDISREKKCTICIEIRTVCLLKIWGKRNLIKKLLYVFIILSSINISVVSHNFLSRLWTENLRFVYACAVVVDRMVALPLSPTLMTTRKYI